MWSEISHKPATKRLYCAMNPREPRYLDDDAPQYAGSGALPTLSRSSIRCLVGRWWALLLRVSSSWVAVTVCARSGGYRYAENKQQIPKGAKKEERLGSVVEGNSSCCLLSSFFVLSMCAWISGFGVKNAFRISICRVSLSLWFEFSRLAFSRVLINKEKSPPQAAKKKQLKSIVRGWS